MAGLRKVRPVLVRGYESMVMARMLLEQPGCSEAILQDWGPLLAATLEAWGEDWQELQLAFEQHRAAWMASDPDSWLANNRPYPGVTAAITATPFPFYIASSKARNRVTTLLQKALGLDLPPDSPRLFCSLLPPNEKKVEALREVMQRPLAADPATRLHFVDDRLETLTAVVHASGLSRWNLYLADWGYNTEAERQQAAATPGIRLLSRASFIELLKWGVMMGVDDGCEPTAEEVAAGVATEGV